MLLSPLVALRRLRRQRPKPSFLANRSGAGERQAASCVVTCTAETPPCATSPDLTNFFARHLRRIEVLLLGGPHALGVFSWQSPSASPRLLVGTIIEKCGIPITASAGVCASLREELPWRGRPL